MKIRKVLTFISMVIFMSAFTISCDSMKTNKNEISKNDTLKGFSSFLIEDIVDSSVNVSSMTIYMEDKKMFNPVLFDDHGIPFREFNGKYIYHPSSICDLVLFNIHSFKQSADSSQLQTAMNYLYRLNEMGLDISNSKFVTYNFNYNLHKIENEDMIAPWTSAISQGKLLAANIRMFELTEDSAYLENSHKIFRSFLPIHKSNNPYWISYIDNDSLLWFEEYPLNSPCNTLNGMIVGIYGIYEYYHLMRSNEAKRILNGSLYTIKSKLEDFRNDSSLSYYCLKHEVQNKYYHSVHIHQLINLYQMTSDTYFKDMAIQLNKDYLLEEKYVIHDLSLLN